MNAATNGKANAATVETVEINILDLAIAATPARREEKPAAPTVKVPTTEQRAEITQLRGIAAVKGGVALALAQSKCNGTYSAAEQYIAMLKIAIEATPAPAEPAVETPAPVSVPLTSAVETPADRAARTAGRVVGAKGATPKQWKYIKHLRSRLYDVREGWAISLAKRSIDNNSRAASAYIKEVLNALERRYQSNPNRKTGGTICCCYVEGCNIGPFVERR